MKYFIQNLFILLNNKVKHFRGDIIPVIGINIRSLNAKRNKNISGNLKINNNPQIKKITKKGINQLNKEGLGIEFEYNCTYNQEDKKNPEVANIKISGEILFLTEKTKEVLKEWKENEKLSDKIAVPVLNTIMRKCITKTIDISEDLQLPPPIRFPTAKKQSETGKYIG